MTGGNIVSDSKQPSSMPNRNQLLKKKTDDKNFSASDQNNEMRTQHDQKKNPFTQRRQTAGQSNFEEKKGENDDSDSDDFDEFYNKNTLDIQNLGETGKKMQNTFGASNDNQGVSMLNRNMSQSQLAAAANAADANATNERAFMEAQKEVELKAQGENS